MNTSDTVTALFGSYSVRLKMAYFVNRNYVSNNSLSSRYYSTSVSNINVTSPRHVDPGSFTILSTPGFFT